MFLEFTPSCVQYNFVLYDATFTYVNYELLLLHLHVMRREEILILQHIYVLNAILLSVLTEVVGLCGAGASRI